MIKHSFRGALGALALTISGCAVPELPRHAPDHWSRSDAYGETAIAAESSPSAARHATEPELSSSAPPARPRDVARFDKSPSRPSSVLPMPSGTSCLRELGERKVAHRVLPSLRGVDNPVEIHSPLGGVAYYATDGRALQMDCRLALVLDQLGPTMEQFGVTRIRYSGAYVYRTTRTGRLSHHAHGLAIDLHEFQTRSSTFSVKHDFKRNVTCDRRAQKLNDLACALRRQPFFEEFLTPDYNADHYDHLHVSVPRMR